MDRSLFRYIWRFSKRDQLIIFAVVLASLPFYYWSLDLPKRIVNEAIQGGAFKSGRTSALFLDLNITLPAFLGGKTYQLFPGIDVDQLGLLFGLSGMFLVLVLVNGAFKYWINVAKGALGERMLRRMRFDLFALTLRFPPETLRTVKSSETATMIKDEVEPIGGFIGDAFVQPLLLGSQALTAMAFILMQNVWLGLIAGFIVAIQFIVIPRLRRIQLRLGKERQIMSRKLAGRVGEVVDGMEAVHVHDATAWERAEIGHRLYELFDLRFRLYKWKFMVKFLNNLLSQITPFFFYAVGGYLALRGRLDIGQLVAVIAAYRDLPPPLKELIDWDQQRLDVQIKYDQVVQQFMPARLLPPELFERDPAVPDHIEGPVVMRDVLVTDAHGTPVVDRFSVEVPLPAHIALVGDGGPGPSAIARVLARRITNYSGYISYGGRDLAKLPEPLIGRRMAYAGVEPVLFPGSLRDNLVYGLRRPPQRGAEDDDGQRERRRRQEALRTGNPVERVDDGWIDYAAVGANDCTSLDHHLLAVMDVVGMRDAVYRFGLSGTVDPERYPDLVGQIVAARHYFRERLAAEGMGNLVAVFEPDEFNQQATIGENLLFGVSSVQAFSSRGLAVNPMMRKILESLGLVTDFIGFGVRIATTMTEIFRDLPAGHPLFEQFSFISADDLPEYDEILRHWAARGAAGLTQDDRSRLIALPFDYIEPKHRLGLIDDDVRARVVQARHRFRSALEDSIWKGLVEFYDPDKVCFAAPLRDNLLFGRIAHGIADARTRVTMLGARLISEMGLREHVEQVGLDYQIGPAGRLLTSQQRVSVYLARSLAKNPDVLILDGALAAFSDEQAKAILGSILERFRGKSVVAVLRNDQQADPAYFETLVHFEGTRPRLVRRGSLDMHRGHVEDAAGAKLVAALGGAALEGEAR